RVDCRLAVVGEVGLSGELRSVSQLERRMGEASKLGFERILVPATLGRGMARPPENIQVLRASSLGEAIEIALGSDRS
ncbi:MAG: DNA repair protein RadA, partial [Chloroflexia bacterium]|nr:DNA repair protein RadA [Chloroflexia bacterium]